MIEEKEANVPLERETLPNAKLSLCAKTMFLKSPNNIGLYSLSERLGESPEAFYSYVEDMKLAQTETEDLSF